MILYTRWFVSVLLLLLPLLLSGQQAVVVGEGFSEGKITGSQVYYLQDPTDQLTIDDLERKVVQTQFKRIPGELINFGYSTDTYWLKIKLDFKQEPVGTLFFDIAYSTLDTIALYCQLQDGRWDESLAGDLIPFEHKEVISLHPVFPIKGEQSGVREYYLRIKSTGTILAPIWLRNHDSLRLSEVREEQFYSVIYGALMVMFFYNFFLYFGTKEADYLIYTVSVAFSLMTQMSFWGHAQWLWGEPSWWVNASITFFIFGFLASILWFAISFLDIRKYSRFLYYYTFSLALINTLACVGSLAIDYTIMVRMSVISVLLSCFSMIFVGSYTWIKGRNSAKFFILAWGVYMSGAFVLAFRNLGVLPDYFILGQAVAIGSVLEVILISFALANRINYMKLEREKAQQESIDLKEQNENILRDQNERLEDQVKQRTRDLEDQRGKLLAQNEELLHIQQKLQEQQAELIKKSEDLAKRGKQINDSIRSALTIQQATFPSKDLLDESFSDYFLLYRPRDIVSGDFYWLSSESETLWLALADCTGHGVPGAFMTLLGKNILEKLIGDYPNATPSHILKMLDYEITRALRQKQTGNMSGMEMSLLKITYPSPDSCKVLFAAGKSKIYYTYPSAKKLYEYKGDNIAIGGIKHKQVTFTDREITLPKGATIYAGSDGYQDQNNSERKKFGSRALKDMLHQYAELPMDQQRAHYEKTLEAHMEGTEQRDDILLMGIKL